MGSLDDACFAIEPSTTTQIIWQYTFKCRSCLTFDKNILPSTTDYKFRYLGGIADGTSKAGLHLQGKPIECMGSQAKEVRRFTDYWKSIATKNFYWNHAIKCRQIQFHSLHKPREISYNENVFIVVVASKGQDFAVFWIQKFKRTPTKSFIPSSGGN